MKISEHCKKDFDKIKNGDFISIWAEQDEKKPMLPIKYERLIVAVVEKENYEFLKFPKEIQGNWYTEDSLFTKIMEVLNSYDDDFEYKKLFTLLPQDYTITSITTIKKSLIKKAFTTKTMYLENHKSHVEDRIKHLKSMKKTFFK